MKRPAKTLHHIIPRSRLGDDSEKNLVMVNKERHILYHSLFHNLTPDEIIYMLVTEFWNGDFSHVKKLTKELK